MNQEIKEQFVKKILKNHIMWSNSEDNMPSQNCGNIRAEYIGIMREQEIGSVDDYWELTTQQRDEFDVMVVIEFENIKQEADKRWHEALAIMGL